ncbi:MAG: J domain-containing protein [Rhodanobacter sp.]
MAQDTNFLDLYKILGLTPDCELADFKQAYRRRVGVLHPDRRANSHGDMIADERLKQLTTLYGEAMTFQRQHGRLPGARQVRTVRPDISPTPRQSITTLPSHTGSRRLLLMLAMCGAGWLLWSSWPASAPTSTSISSTPTAAVAPDTSSNLEVAAKTINIGADAALVRRLQGTPILVSGNRWDYGPSWIRFENDKVVAWYSSPVRPLKTVSTQP